ncbi:MAG: alkaline phosphatase [Phycisphaeraceae bacterium]|nr:alkaline phosphatase [Phycisphaeraceae bacterium]
MNQSPSRPLRTISRRGFLKAGSAIASAGLLANGRLASASAGAFAPISRVEARNIIFMVSDGMSLGTLSIADIYSRRILGRPSNWCTLMATPHARRALQDTQSANSIVTDSAAAASAWGIGVKVNNNAVNVTPTGETPEPVLVTAKKAGRSTGLVTTCRVTHATPAGFIANCPDRDLEVDIAAQILDRKPDVVLGGGASRFAGIIASSPGVRCIRTREELLAIDTAKPLAQPLLGVFAPEHMSMQLDRKADGATTEPTLAEMSRSAISLLSAHQAGFILQIEGGRVDHAAHANDAGSLLAEQLAFDEAIGVAMKFALSRDDTLLVVTTDHGNANPGLTFYGKAGDRGFAELQKAARSFEWIDREATRRGVSGDARAEVTAELVREAAGFPLDSWEVDTLKRFFRRQRVEPFSTANEFYPVLGSLLANHTGVAFASPNHTADLTEVTAFGPGSAAIAPCITNTDLYAVMTAAAGIGAHT